MKILLTGSTGLIGKELGKALVAKGHEVLSVSRSANRAKKLLPYLTEVVEWDGVQEFPREALSEIDGVIHLMGENISEARWSDQIKKKLIDSRVDSTRNLKQACDQHASKLKFWIQGSAIGFYGDSKQETIFDEGSPNGEGFLSELCQKWEGALDFSSSRLASIRKVILRTGVVFSHRGGALEKMINPLMAGVGGVIGSGKQRMSFIHLTDLVNFMVHAAEHEDVSGVFNMVSETLIPQKVFVEKLSEKLSISTGLSIPKFAIKLAMGEMGELLLQDQAVVSKRVFSTGFRYLYPTIDPILDEIVQWHRHPKPEDSSPTHLFYSEQFTTQPLEKIFQFFSNAKNLESITPEWLNFHIVEMSTTQIEKDTKIEYQLKLHGVSIQWLTNIAVWEPPFRFVDEQLKGPYHLWYHEHVFKEVNGGVLMQDWVRFQLPMGKAGMVGLPKIYHDIRGIFAHRTDIIDQILNSTETLSSLND